MRRTRPDSISNIEQDVATWAPITPPVAPSSQPLSFVDGVRRMEARLVVTRHGRTVHGALGAYGVGVVECREGRATFAEERLGRVAIFGAGEMPPSGSRACAVAPLPAPERCRGRCRCAAARPARRDAHRGGGVGPRPCRRRTYRHRRWTAQRRRVHARARRRVREAAVQALSAARAAARVAAAAARHPYAGVPHHLSGPLLAIFVVPAHRPATRNRIGLHRPGAPRSVRSP